MPEIIVSDRITTGTSPQGGRLYWSINTDTSWGGCCYLDQAVEALVKAAEERGLDPKAVRSIAERKGKEDSKVWGMDLVVCAVLEREGSLTYQYVTMQVVIHWESRTSRGKPHYVAWAASL